MVIKGCPVREKPAAPPLFQQGVGAQRFARISNRSRCRRRRPYRRRRTSGSPRRWAGAQLDPVPAETARSIRQLTADHQVKHPPLHPVGTVMSGRNGLLNQVASMASPASMHAAYDIVYYRYRSVLLREEEHHDGCAHRLLHRRTLAIRRYDGRRSCSIPPPARASPGREQLRRRRPAGTTRRRCHQAGPRRATRSRTCWPPPIEVVARTEDSPR